MAEVERADKTKDLDELIALWKEVFHDTDDFLLPFVKHRLAEATILQTKADGKIVSAVWLLPLTLCAGEKESTIHLLVGAATLPSHRKQGLMGAIIEEAKKLFPSIILYPEENKRHYYRKHGFKDTETKVCTLNVQKLKETQNPDIKTLNAIYEEAHKDFYIKRDEYAWQTILDNKEVYLGDGLYFIKAPNGNNETCLTHNVQLEPYLISSEDRLSGMYYGEDLSDLYIPEFY